MLEGEQKHSLLSARIARQIIADRREAETASTAALLHDVGTLALASRLPDEHRACIEQSRSRSMLMHRVEGERLGVTHAEIGAYLLGLWALPHDIIDAVASHHVPWDAVQTLDLTAAVKIADSIASEFVYDPTDASTHCEPPPHTLLDRLGLSPTLDKIRGDIELQLQGSRR
jgi:putative nucleotidyltransferase with HDIG domain